jgi:hypothetical protein
MRVEVSIVWRRLWGDFRFQKFCFFTACFEEQQFRGLSNICSPLQSKYPVLHQEDLVGHDSAYQVPDCLDSKKINENFCKIWFIYFLYFYEQNKLKT